MGLSRFGVRLEEEVGWLLGEGPLPVLSFLPSCLRLRRN